LTWLAAFAKAHSVLTRHQAGRKANEQSHCLSGGWIHILTDEQPILRRWGIREAIEAMGLKLLEDTAIEVDASVLDASGWTAIGFKPHE
jgi:hypothetical protein